MRLRVTQITLYRLAAEAARDPATVQAVLAGRGNAMSRAAVLAAARRLGTPETDSIVVALTGGG